MGARITAPTGPTQTEQVQSDEARRRMAEIESKTAATVAATGAAMRGRFATPAPGQQPLTIPTPAAVQPIGGIVSSMARIGGDLMGPSVSAMDIQRQQLQAQQRTADNTARLVAQMKPQVVASSTVVYQ